MRSGGDEATRLAEALRWLERHHQRLGIRKRSLESQLSEVASELDRLAGEIEQARKRLRELSA